MRRIMVGEVMVPLKPDTPPLPNVGPGDPLMEAVRFMMENQLKSVAVAQRGRPVGTLEIERAFAKLGLTPDA